MNTLKLKIAPSILSADFGCLNAEIKSVEPYSDLIHVDVMDGHFVPNITIGAPVVKKMKTKLPLDVHLMIENPEKYIKDFVEAGSAIITIHAEAVKNLPKIIKQIKSYGVKAGVSIKPKTSVSKIKSVLKMLDMVLVMTVEPGFGGQSFMDMTKKISELRRLRPTMDISVDGGVNEKTSKLVLAAGANVLVAGSYIFGAKDRKKAIQNLL
ncbi:MAG: ribulose-phosphate 3-epimerase [Candidatus Gracilibacteria bacterium]|jgi:ribulose-phosphate 3-epimerase